MTQNDSRPDGGTVEERDAQRSESLLTRIWYDVAERYERFQSLEKDEMEVIDRHGLGARISHWSMVLFMLLCVLTGLAFWLGWYGLLETGIWGGYSVTWVVHLWAGILLAVVVFVLYPFYHAVVDGHPLLVFKEGLKEQLVIGLAFVGLASYIPGFKKARKTYDVETETWQASHPTQTIFWYVTWFFVGVLTLTGFGLWRHVATDPAWWISALGFLAASFGKPLLLGVHVLSMFIIITAVAIHVYLSLLPANWTYLTAMIFGPAKGWAVDVESLPEGTGRYRTTDALANRLDLISSRAETQSEQATEGDGSGEAAEPSDRPDSAEKPETESVPSDTTDEQ